MDTSSPTTARGRVLLQLKTHGPQSAAELGDALGVTAMAVRYQLQALDADGLVAFDDHAGQVGRPRRIWSLTDQSAASFPDSHAELAVGLIEGVRAAFGDEGLARLVERRTDRQIEAYVARMPDAAAGLGARVAALAGIRSEEGYMAHASKADDGALLLVENHCPICAAATCCVGLCAGEQRLFETVLGPEAHVERTEHLLDGARRCVYRITMPT